MNAEYAYDMIDRFLRNNLGDDDYAEYSEALDALLVASSEVSALKAELDLARAQLEAEYRINSETLSILERTEQKLNFLLDRATVAKVEGGAT